MGFYKVLMLFGAMVSRILADLKFCFLLFQLLKKCYRNNDS